MSREPLSFSHRFFLVLHRPGDRRLQDVLHGVHGINQHGPVLRGEGGKVNVVDLARRVADPFGEGLRLGPLPCRRGCGIGGLLGGDLGLLIPVLPEFGQHAPFLLLPGDLDEDVLGDGGATT